MGNKYPLSKVNSDISLDIFPRCTFADTAHLMLWKYVHLWFIIQPKMPALQCGGVQMELMLFVRHQISAKSCLFVNCPPPTAFKVSFVLFPNLFATWSMAECGKESNSNNFQHHRHKFRIFLINMNGRVELDATQAWSMILKANVTFKSDTAPKLQRICNFHPKFQVYIWARLNSAFVANAQQGVLQVMISLNA